MHPRRNMSKIRRYVSYRPLYAILSCVKLSLHHNQVWQCNSIATLNFSYMSFKLSKKRMNDSKKYNLK